MGRKRTSLGEDLVDVVAMLPWWACLAMALGSYLTLHQMAVPPQLSLQPGQTGGFIYRVMIAGLATAAQFIVPMLCLIAALISFLRRRKRETLVTNVAQSKSADALNDMSWAEFETLVGEAFRLQGYQVSECGGPGADGGVDVVLRKGSEKFLVQCKQWKAYKVGVDVVRQLYGVMAAQGAAGGFVMTSGSFTADARAFAEGRNVKLVDGPKLFALIQQARSVANRPSPAARAEAAVPQRHPALRVASDPVCPACQSSMVRRTAKKGAKVGSQFWGCSRFPACRGTL
jgi:restriction system protein